MARQVVIKPTDRGGFGVVSVTLKVSALLSQWVRRLSSSEGAWVSTLTHFRADPVAVLSRPFDFNFSVLPPFYASLFKAWHFAGGFFSPSLGGLVVGYGSTDAFLVSSSTARWSIPFCWSATMLCPIAFLSTALCSASYIGRPHGVSCLFAPSTVRPLTLLGRLRMACLTPLTA